MNALRHHFLVLWLCQRHNRLLDEGHTEHLNPFAHMHMLKKPSSSYGCTLAAKKRPSAAKKRPSAHSPGLAMRAKRGR